MGSISSTSSLLKSSSAQASKEDLTSNTLERKSASNLASNTLERKSTSKLGMSCLASSTTDEDTEFLVKSPEKKTLSPSNSVSQSISDIFAKSVKNRTEETIGVARLVIFQIEFNLVFKLIELSINIYQEWSKVLFRKSHFFLSVSQSILDIFAKSLKNRNEETIGVARLVIFEIEIN